MRWLYEQNDTNCVKNGDLVLKMTYCTISAYFDAIFSKSYWNRTEATNTHTYTYIYICIILDCSSNHQNKQSYCV